MNRLKLEIEHMEARVEALKKKLATDPLNPDFNKAFCMFDIELERLNSQKRAEVLAKAKELYAMFVQTGSMRIAVHPGLKTFIHPTNLALAPPVERKILEGNPDRSKGWVSVQQEAIRVATEYWESIS